MSVDWADRKIMEEREREVEREEAKVREIRESLLARIREYWDEGATVRVELSLKHSPYLDRYYYPFRIWEAEDQPPQFIYRYRVNWISSDYAKEEFSCVLILPPATEDPDAIELLPEILPKNSPLDFTLPAKVMDLFEKLYGTYSTPAHVLRMASRSRGGDYPDDEIEIEVVYREHEPEDDCDC